MEIYLGCNQRQPGLRDCLPPTSGQHAKLRRGPGLPSRSHVELRDGTLSVKQQDRTGTWQTVWKTDPDWRVTGYTVGDADADGHPELVYTVWKQRLTWTRPQGGGMAVNMDGGPVLPHIYIDGWRRGAINPVWHGSPRPAPILAVAVAPIGKVGKPLLAALESQNTAYEKAPGPLRIWEWTGRLRLQACRPGARHIFGDVE